MLAGIDEVKEPPATYGDDRAERLLRERWQELAREQGSAKEREVLLIFDTVSVQLAQASRRTPDEGPWTEPFAMLTARALSLHRFPGRRAMTSSSLTLALDPLRIPAGAGALDGFRRWARSPEFPEGGRIDYLAGDLEVEMSPEDLYTHGAPKAEIAATLQELIARSGRGVVFVDRARVTVPAAGLSVEPDVTAVLWRTLESGRVREIPSAVAAPGRFVELQGPPDLIVEVVSDASVRKDRQRLPALYAEAGVPEIWLVDARGAAIDFTIRCLAAGRYEEAVRRGEWIASPLLQRELRLTRRETGASRWSYRLEARALRGAED